MQLARSLLTGSFAVALFAVSANATAIGTGQFNLGGNLYVTTSEILFGFHTVPPPGDETAIVNLPATGAFSDLTAGELATIKNLFMPPTGPVTPGTSFLLPSWVVLPDGINMDLTDVLVNTGIGVCTGTAADNTPGTECRPYASSPIVLSQSQTGVTAKLNVQGDAYTGTSAQFTRFNGLFSADFTAAPDNTISGLLGGFATNGFVETGYEANFSTVPEPATLAATAGALLGLAFLLKRYRKA